MKFLFALTTLSLALAVNSAGRAPVRVELQKDGERVRLLRDGKSFVIKGLGGNGSMELAARMGANSIRTWGAERLGEVLDEAQKHGLTVCAGIWLGHERHGFRYDDPAQVSRQKEEVRRVVLRYKDHPALLLWGLGNEMEGDGRNEAIWRAVNDIAVMVKELDPHHPTMTVIAEIGGDKVQKLHRLCPAVDIVGINTYAGAATLPERYKAAGGRKPYILTEFGPPGTWEVSKTAWGAPLEPTSTEKAQWYRRAWRSNVGKSPLCLGGYAFLWGHKQETTSTWFGMLLPDGSRLAAADAMQELWSGQAPQNRCPSVGALTVRPSVEVSPGTEVDIMLEATDPDGDTLQVEWRLVAEATVTGVGGDAEPVPPEYPEALLRSDLKGARVKMPDKPGGYRVFVFVRDGKGGAATANVPVRVLGSTTAGRKATLPLVLYGEPMPDPPPYVPSGWMGNTSALRLNEQCTVQPASGKFCLECRYEASDGWAGVVWQHPAGDWGDQPGGWDLTGAKRVRWKARGAAGGERLTFLFGLLGADKVYSDTAQLKLENVTLTREWKTYSIDLTGRDLSRIKTGFGWTLAGQGRPVTFYLDDIRVE